jgi:hypothetical protein
MFNTCKPIVFLACSVVFTFASLRPIFAIENRLSVPTEYFEQIFDKDLTDYKISYKSFRLNIDKKMELTGAHGERETHTATDYLEVSEDGNFRLQLTNLYNQKRLSVVVFGKKAFITEKSSVTGAEKIRETDQTQLFMNMVNKLLRDWIDLHQRHGPLMRFKMKQGKGAAIKITGNLAEINGASDKEKSRHFEKLSEEIEVGEDFCVRFFQLSAVWNKDSGSAPVKTNFTYTLKITAGGEPISNLNLKPLPLNQDIMKAKNPLLFKQNKVESPQP